MSLFKPAVNGTAYLKLGMLGFEGSGKTFTAIDFGIGMCKLQKKKKIAFYDTEKGSDFHIDRVKKEGLELVVLKSRSFKDLCDAIREVEQDKEVGFLIIDSITHVWRDLVETWLKKKGRSFLTMKDWGVLKTEWGQYTDLYVNSKLSIAMLGRAGHEYETDEDEDGNSEIKKSGTKMKVETETGFEPDLLLEMFKSPKVTITQVKGKKKIKKERGFINKCVVLKDRTNTMNGFEIEMPKFKDFSPIIKSLNIGGDHQGVDLTRTSDGIFTDDERSYYAAKRRKDIAIEQIQETLVLADMSGTSKEAVKKRTETLIKYFGTSTQGGINAIDAKTLESSLLKMKGDLLQNDPIPNGLDHSAKTVEDEKLF